MTLLYYDPVFLEHDTGPHPERAERLRAVARRLEETGLEKACTRPEWRPVSDEQIERVHDPGYVAEVGEFCASRPGQIEADTVVSRRSYEVARQAAGAACDAVARVLSGQDTQALCLLRPPGHHALRHQPMGFCLFNNIAIAARAATADFGLDRLLVVDWDVHHGNGTQDAFWEDERVGFLSIHRWPFYPGTGSANETGGGKATGTTLNLPLTFGTPRSQYIELFVAELKRFAEKIRPQLVLVSAGFDSHKNDPVGSLGLEIEDFAALTTAVLDVAETHAAGRIVSLLEGGYDPNDLAECVETHLRTMMDRQRASG